MDRVAAMLQQLGEGNFSGARPGVYAGAEPDVEAEMALVSLRGSQIKQLAHRGRRGRRVPRPVQHSIAAGTRAR
jgi:hypothetical protein